MVNETDMVLSCPAEQKAIDIAAQAHTEEVTDVSLKLGRIYLIDCSQRSCQERRICLQQ